MQKHVSECLWGLRIIAIVILLCSLVFSATPSHEAPRSIPVDSPSPREPTYSIYELAEMVTGAPAHIVAGIAFAESSGGIMLDHPDPLDVGYFGLHESPEYHAERAKKWGEYDANNPTEAAIITGYLYMENLARLGSERLAIAAHLQGARGVLKNGPEEWYIERVYRSRSRH